MKDNFYLLGCLTRSFDKDHEKQDLVHLIGSFFYTNSFDINKLKLENINVNEPLFIIRVGNRDLLNWDIIYHGPKIVEIILPLIYLLSKINNVETYNIDKAYKEKLAYDVDNLFKFLFNSFTNSPEVIDKGLIINNKLNNSLFVFEDLNLSNIKLIFKSLGIKISGGSLNKRDLLSSTQYTLSNYLNILGYKGVDIYNSNRNNQLWLNNNFSLGNFSEIIIKDTDIMKDFILNILLKQKSDFNDTKEENLNKLTTKKNNILSLETEKLNLNTKKKKLNKTNISSTRFLNLTKSIERLQTTVSKIEIEISELETKLDIVNKEIEKVNESSEEQIKEIYFREYHNNQINSINKKVLDTVKKNIRLKKDKQIINPFSLNKKS